MTSYCYLHSHDNVPKTRYCNRHTVEIRKTIKFSNLAYGYLPLKPHASNTPRLNKPLWRKKLLTNWSRMPLKVHTSEPYRIDFPTKTCFSFSIENNFNVIFLLNYVFPCVVSSSSVPLDLVTHPMKTTFLASSWWQKILFRRVFCINIQIVWTWVKSFKNSVWPNVRIKEAQILPKMPKK